MMDELTPTHEFKTDKQLLEEARAEIDELLKTLKETRQTLETANAWPDGGGAIVDTIWYSAHETLFDFMDAAIAKHSTKAKEQ